MFGLFAAILLYKSVRPSLRCIHGAVGMINVRGEFSTAAKNATKKRHRLPPSPSFVSTPLSTLLFFQANGDRDGQTEGVRSFVRSFVRLGFCSKAIKILSSHSPRYKSRRRRRFHAHGAASVRCGERSESKNSSEPGADFSHRRHWIWRTICYSDDKERISYAAVADDFKSSRMILTA